MNGRTNGRTDERTDKVTTSLLELLIAAKNKMGSTVNSPGATERHGVIGAGWACGGE